MTFKLAENLPELVRELLCRLGYDTHTVAEEGLAGARDEVVLQACVAEQRILITLGLDFSDIRAYPPGSYPGVWVLRPPKQTFQAIESLVRAGVRLSAVERVNGQLWVIDDKRVRIRDGGQDHARQHRVRFLSYPYRTHVVTNRSLDAG